MSTRIGMQGFSLIELTAIIVLLATGLVSIMAVFTTASRSVSGNIDHQLGAQLAQERAEQVLADRRSTDPARGFNYIVAANYPNEGAIAGFAAYARTTAITAIAGGTPPCPAGANCRQVVVTVSRAGQRAGQVTFMVVDY